jgi:hypothetical protein
MPVIKKPTINVSYIYGDNKLRDMDKVLLSYFNSCEMVSKIYPDIYSLPREEAIAKLQSITETDLVLFSNSYNADQISCPLNSHGEGCDSPWYITYNVEGHHYKNYQNMNNNLVTILDLNAAKNSSASERVDILEKVKRSDSLLVLYAVSISKEYERIGAKNQRLLWDAKEIFVFNDGHMNLNGQMVGFLGMPARDWLYEQPVIFSEISRQMELFK